MFLAQYWTLETSFRPFYDFNEMTIKQDLPIFISFYLPFSILPYLPFQKKWNNEKHNWLCSNWSRLLSLKGPGM